ncbi:hypothetical protein ACIHCQ_41020 [Streptomyces sp. NPDC052236]|uniref:hypothetical protein n=1 Tax=Streptomyces sp. NPDC052236 TaxID=3365686 RepID=UPI0037D41703
MQQLLALGETLREARRTLDAGKMREAGRQQVMEATDYWRGAFCLLEDDLNVTWSTPRAKGVPGRKTDVAGAAWLCRLGE